MWAKQRGKEVAHNKRKIYDELCKRLEAIEKELFDPSINDKLLMKEMLQQKIEEIIEKEAASGAFRSGCQFVRDNEKNIKYFLSKEKYNFNKKTMTQLINGKTNL